MRRTFSSHKLQRKKERKIVIQVCFHLRATGRGACGPLRRVGRRRAAMQSHQRGLTFYREDAGAGCSASAVHGLTHVLALVLREGFRQVQTVRLAPFDVLIVLTVLEHLALKPPGHLRLRLAGDLHAEPDRLGVHHRQVLQGLFEPRRPRPGGIFFIFEGRGAVDDARLVVDIVLFLLQIDHKLLLRSKLLQQYFTLCRGWPFGGRRRFPAAQTASSAASAPLSSSSPLPLWLWPFVQTELSCPPSVWKETPQTSQELIPFLHPPLPKKQ